MNSYRYNDLHFATAPPDGRERLTTLLILFGPPFLLLAINVVYRLALPWWGWWLLFFPLVLTGIMVCISRIRELKLEDNTLLVRLPLRTIRFELTGLQSVEADSQALSRSHVLNRSWKKTGNDGLGGMISGSHIYICVSNPAKSVVLRWANRIVLVSPKDTDWFIESVRKRTGLQ